jgi:hypothetical protein
MRQKNVAGLDVAVDQVAFVQELQALEHLPRVVRGGLDPERQRAVTVN